MQKNGRLPNGRKPVLYAIGGKAGLGTVDDYDKELEKRQKQDPKVKHHYYNNQAQLAQYVYCDRSPLAPYGHDIIIEFRYKASDGGDEKVIRRAPTLNDTGSNV
ncbi:hypothetical protein LA080_012979 [Diaporthe eres]|nr:hypothetical protein LA080_012979 [Diaporthe eres]